MVQRFNTECPTENSIKAPLSNEDVIALVLRIQFQAIWCQRFADGLNPVAFFSFSERGILSVDLLYDHDSKVFQSMV